MRTPASWRSVTTHCARSFSTSRSVSGMAVALHAADFLDVSASERVNTRKMRHAQVRHSCRMRRLQSVPLTCRRFNALLSRPDMWQTLHFGRGMTGDLQDHGPVEVRALAWVQARSSGCQKLMIEVRVRASFIQPETFFSFPARSA